MLISRLTLQIARASRFAGCLRPRLVVPLSTLRPAVFSSYSTHPLNRPGSHSQLFQALDPELEDMLVPRKMSISPLETWLTVQYSFLKDERAATGGQERLVYEPVQEYDLPPSPQNVGHLMGEEEEEGAGELNRDKMECRRILKIRRRKMNRHKYKKLMKRTRFLRRKIKLIRQKKKQKRFEKDLLRVARRAGLKKLPEGWVLPTLAKPAKN